jgi:hypothetical protein
MGWGGSGKGWVGLGNWKLGVGLSSVGKAVGYRTGVRAPGCRWILGSSYLDRWREGDAPAGVESRGEERSQEATQQGRSARHHSQIQNEKMADVVVQSTRIHGRHIE